LREKIISFITGTAQQVPDDVGHFVRFPDPWDPSYASQSIYKLLDPCRVAFSSSRSISKVMAPNLRPESLNAATVPKVDPNYRIRVVRLHALKK
jgi:hypothetical protein